jgi:hypothetical protein
MNEDCRSEKTICSSAFIFSAFFPFTVNYFQQKLSLCKYISLTVSLL